MTDAKYQSSEVETLELLDSSTLDMQTMPVVCGGGTDPNEMLMHAAWFNPGRHVEWFGSGYWRGPQACRFALSASPVVGKAGRAGYRLPITWGSSSKH